MGGCPCSARRKSGRSLSRLQFCQLNSESMVRDEGERTLLATSPSRRTTDVQAMIIPDYVHDYSRSSPD
jgi:hypothetical protein